jgi:hypothetical protein
VTISGTDYLLLWRIPDLPDGRIAVVDPSGRELVSPREAYDAIITDAWTGKPYPYDWAEQYEIAQRKRSEAKFYETANNVGSLAVDALATYAMAQVNPAAGVGPALNLLEDSLNWTTDDYDGDAYREGMSKLRRFAENAGAVESRLRDIDRTDSLPEEGVEVVSTGVDIYGKMSDVKSVGSAMTAAYKSSHLYSSAVTAGGAAAGSALFYFAVGELVASGVETITTGFKQNAKLAAANHAYNTMRLPILNELVELTDRARDGRLSPGQIIRMHLLEQQHWNVCKIGNATMHRIVTKLNQSLLGGVWDVLVDSTEAQSVLGERRDLYEWAAAASHAELGEWWNRSDDLYAASINREVYGDV